MGDQGRIPLDQDVIVEEATDILPDRGASCAFPLSWFADTYKHSYEYAYIYAYKHIRTYMHTYINTFMHAYVHTCICNKALALPYAICHMPYAI